MVPSTIVNEPLSALRDLWPLYDLRLRTGDLELAHHMTAQITRVAFRLGRAHQELTFWSKDGIEVMVPDVGSPANCGSAPLHS